MKIVINKCYGGFGLSPLAVKRLAELNGKKCYFYMGGLGYEYKKTSIEECKSSGWWSAFSIDDTEEIRKTCCTPKNWASMSKQEKDARNQQYEEISLDTRPDDRTDTKLIQVVEELGESASGKMAELKIVEIPDGVKWEIDDYDGIEDIHEVHRSWS